MPFICDDEKYLMVDADEEYDKRRFIIVRKLFITPMKKKSEFNEETLNKYFRKYGDIQSIEVFNPMEQDAKGTKQSKAYAYVTFESDLSAFATVSDNDNQILWKSKNCVYNIRPANTWKQPSQQNSTIESKILDETENHLLPIFMMNEDCFEKLFQYLDVDSLLNLLEVCKKLNVLVHERGFKQVKSLKYGDNETLAQIRRKIKCVGEHINQLQFYFGGRYVQRSFEVLCKHVGKNIRGASFEVACLDERIITIIKPMLESLTSLEIDSRRNYERRFNFNFDSFQTMASNLKKLKLRSYSVSLYKCTKSWPTLEYLSVSSLNSNSLCEILKNNPQITTLKLPSYVLQDVGTHLPNLQRLTIYSKYSVTENLIQSLRPLVALNNLTKLSFVNVKIKDFNGILNLLNEFPSLRKLKYFGLHDEGVGRSEPIQQSIISLAQHLPYLEKICLAHIRFEKCPSVFLEFIRFATNLKEIHMHQWGLEMTQDFALQIVEVLKSSRPQNTAPMTLYIDKHDVIDLEAIQEPRIKNYLHVSENCERGHLR